MRPWRSSYRCQHHRWLPPWKKNIIENESQIFSRILDQNVKHLTAGSVAAENLVWVAWVNEYISNHDVRLVYWVCAMFSDVSSRGERTRERRQGRLTLWTLIYLWARKEAFYDSSGPTSWPGGRESWAQSQKKTTKRWRKKYLDTKRFGRPLAHWTVEHQPVWEVNTLWAFKKASIWEREKRWCCYQIAFCSPWVVESDTSVCPSCKQTSVVFTVAQREECFVAHDLAPPISVSHTFNDDHASLLSIWQHSNHIWRHDR